MAVFLMRALVDAVGTRIREYKGFVYVPDLKNKIE